MKRAIFANKAGVWTPSPTPPPPHPVARLAQYFETSFQQTEIDRGLLFCAGQSIALNKLGLRVVRGLGSM